MKTRQELIAATLKKLNVIAAGQDPETEDVQEIDLLIDGKLAEMNRRKILWFSSKTEFADEHFDCLAVILADQAAPLFGQPSNPESRIFAENRLREMRNIPRVDSDVTPSEYF